MYVHQEHIHMQSEKGIWGLTGLGAINLSKKGLQVEGIAPVAGTQEA